MMMSMVEVESVVDSCSESSEPPHLDEEYWLSKTLNMKYEGSSESGAEQSGPPQTPKASFNQMGASLKKP